MPFTLPDLPYAFDALEPVIDKETMQIHHGKHHASYVSKTNGYLEQAPELAGLSLEEILADDCAKVPAAIREQIRHNGAQTFNHNLFWRVMSPDGGGDPSGALAEAINATFGDFDRFKEKFSLAAADQFGSGWAWLALVNGKLEVYSTSNEDSPILHGHVPLLTLDVWEHAYYLKYRNRRAVYIAMWWNRVNWPEVERRFDENK